MFQYSIESTACVSWTDSTLWNTSNISMQIILVKRKKRTKEKENIQFATLQNFATCLKKDRNKNGYVPHLYQFIHIQV